MLEDCCDKCNIPLFRKRSAAEVFCVQCIRSPSEDPATHHPLESAKNEKEDEESQIVKERREKSKKASTLMGPYLLQGYTMLNETCPSKGCTGVSLKGYVF
jgi:uncharacterized Zn finger protein (UPF0148 family)